MARTSTPAPHAARSAADTATDPAPAPVAAPAGDSRSGVPATEVARRAGHGVAVLLKIYAHCIDGQADAANKRITDALGTTEPSPAPAVKKTTAASRQPEMPGQQPDAEQNGQQTAPPDGQHTAPAPAVRARPWIPCLPAPARTDA
jgi:hypothetical protein